MPTFTPTLRGDDEVDAIPPGLLSGGGVATLLIWLFWMLATGRLVTRREHDNRMADKDAQIARQDRTIEVKDAQIEKLAVVGEAFLKIMTSVESLAKGRSR